MTSVPLKFLTILMLGLSSICAVRAQTEPLGDGVALADDLRAVIILAGYPCVRVAKVDQTRTTEYHVSCTADREYRVHVSEEEDIVVESLSGASPAKAPADVSHEDFMKRKFFSIVNLAGHQCTNVLAYEYREPRDSLVTCEDQTVYRIHVTPEGRLAVEKQTLGK